MTRRSRGSLQAGANVQDLGFSVVPKRQEIFSHPCFQFRKISRRLHLFCYSTRNDVFGDWVCCTSQVADVVLEEGTDTQRKVSVIVLTY